MANGQYVFLWGWCAPEYRLGQQFAALVRVGTLIGCQERIGGEMKCMSEPSKAPKLMLCQDCLKVAEFSLPAHLDEVRCECGGQWCGCWACEADAEVIREKLLKCYDAAGALS